MTSHRQEKTSFFPLFKNFMRKVLDRFSLFHATPNIPVKPETEKLILWLIIQKNMKQSLVVNIIEIPIIITTYNILMTVDSPIYVNLWLAYQLIVSNTFRSICIYLSYKKYRHNDVFFWRRIYTFMAVLTASSWAIVGSILMPSHAPDVQLYIVFLILGMVSGAMPILSPLLREYTLFLLIIMVPFTLGMILKGGKISLFGILLPCWITVTLVAAFHIRNLLFKALLLQYENKDLYDETMKAKRDLEEINNNLIFEIRLRKAIEKRLEAIATHDTLTGLPNRALLNTFITETLTKADLLQNRVAIVFLDMDNFKPINDTFGHHTGDKLLMAIGERLLHRIRKTDFICRVGGDEFIVVITNITSPMIISPIVENILHSLSEQYTLEKLNFTTISASAGISIYPEDGKDLDQLVKLADIAMYQAKEQGGNAYRFYKPHSPEQDLLN